MNEQVFYYAIIELGVSILLGVLILYFAYRILDKYLRKKYDIDLNTSYSIFCSSILFSVAYLISGIKTPILNSIRLLQDKVDYEGLLLFDGFKYTALFLVITLIVIAFVNILSIFLFTIMTRDLDEFDEIKNNNIGVSIILAIIIISISLLVKDSLYLLLESFVPYPSMPTFN
jgi:hypothetical protein|tara:strand:- start:67 stop:585 length:519 start_codon:yes stop_codon:yes gene_type:complete